MKNKLVIITKDIHEKIGGLTGRIESKNGDFVLTIPFKGNQLWEEIFGVDQRIKNLIRAGNPVAGVESEKRKGWK